VFKFFRVYNKLILVIGASLLMVAFLIQPVMSIFTPDINSMVMGHIDGRKVTRGDMTAAAAELRVLERLPLIGDMTDRDALKWMLMVHDAKRLGLSASDAEIADALQAVGLREAELRQLAANMQTKMEFIQQAVRHWLAVQNYRELILGQTHMAVDTRLAMLAAANEFMRQGNIYAAYDMFGQASGSQRLSEPLIQRFLQDQRATASATAVLIDSARYLDKVPEPTQERLQELFEKYRDQLPGQSEPYGFGYRMADRVKLEYLSIPMDEITKKVTVSEAEALEYYDQHPAEFPAVQATTQPLAATLQAQRPYASARQEIITSLKAQKAEELAEKIAKTAQGLLLDDVRGLREHNGYRQVPADFSPTPMRVVADALEGQFGLRPQAHRYDNDWILASKMSELPGIGFSALSQYRNVSFMAYVLSAKELEPAADNPLAALRLQVGVPSLPLRSADGSRFVFRIKAAEAARTPQALEEVREQLSRDAKALAAYELLLSETDQWRERTVEGGLKAVAEEVGREPIEVTQVPRRDIGGQGGLVAPSVEGIGQSDAFIGELFAVAELANESGSIEQASPADRMGAVGIDGKLSLALFELKAYQPMTRSQFATLASLPRVSSWVNQTLLAGNGENPLSVEMLSKRVGYVPYGEERQSPTPDDGAPAQSAPDDAS
jgi:hypothetical protein